VSQVRQEIDRVATSRLVTIGAVAILIFAIAIYWAARIQARHGQGLHNRAPLRSQVGRQEIGMVFQTPFDRPFGIAAQINAAKMERLGRYGWIDRDRGIVHIPIERAMQLIVEGGHL
jgi:hypothetical protein